MKRGMKPAARMAEIARIIEAADARCLAADGAVTHLRDEITNAEWRRIYALANPRHPTRKARRRD